MITRTCVNPSSYPHIFDSIIDELPLDALYPLRTVCKYLRDRVDLILARHVVLKFPRKHYPQEKEEGYPRWPGRGDDYPIYWREVAQPEHESSALRDCLMGVHGRLPHLYGYLGEKGDEESEDRERDEESEDRERHDRLDQYLRPFVATRVLDLHGCDADFPRIPEYWDLIDSMEHLQVVRTEEFGGYGATFIDFPFFTVPKTWVHFTTFRLRTDVLTILPPDIQTLVLNVDMNLSSAVDDGTLRYDHYCLNLTVYSSKMENLVVRFVRADANIGLGLDKEEPRTPVRCVGAEPRRHFLNALLVFVGQCFDGGSVHRLTFVDFPDPEIIHPSHLLWNCRVSSFDGVLKAVRDKLVSSRDKDGPRGAKIKEWLNNIEFISDAEYRSRLDDETYKVHTDGSAFDWPEPIDKQAGAST